jgi:NAD(P)-dependent dehydrogenase (short-subunit alcohol dehydrogenase family)
MFNLFMAFAFKVGGSNSIRESDMNVFGTSAIVTGGASGLGEAVVRALAAAGAKVSIFDQNEDLGLRVADEVGGTFCKADVTSEASVETAFAKARDAHGQERVLVNCAGVSSAVKTAGHSKTSGLIEHFPLDKFNFVIQVNLIGTFRCIAKAAAGMLALEPIDQAERGVIINTASVAAEDGQIGQAAYSASKGGIVAMTLPVARDLAGYGIRVNTILPGIFKTPMMRTVPMSVQTALGASVPFPKRLGEPHEFASLALEMIRNPYLNGEDVRLDGSLRMGPR